MTTPLEWEKLITELESQARAVRTSEGAKTIKSKVQEAMTDAESNTAPCVIIDRLDLLMLALTESSRENVCTNTIVSSLRQEMQDALKYNNKDPGVSRT